MPWLSTAQARSMTEEERMDYLTRTVLGEAAGEGYVGMVVVGQVIANRSRDGRFPNDPVAVAGQANQFSTHSSVGGVGNQDRVAADYPKSSKEYRMARAAVEATVINGTAPDITGGAVQYHTVQMGWPSTWPTSIKRNGFIDIGNHRVYPSHPVPPGDIPGAIAKLELQGNAAANSVRVSSLAPIRPATLSTQLRLQRETNRVASQRANATTIRTTARALAFQSVANPFDVGRPSVGGSPVVNRPQPAMRESMAGQLRATGTPNNSARAFALQNEQPAERTFVSTATLRRQAPPVATAPWGVRESVAAAVAATDAAAGRGQLVMTGNPNAPRSVVSWLYPTIKEGEGEGNPVGKGPRNAPVKPAPGQSQIERSPPRVVVKDGVAVVEAARPATTRTAAIVAAATAAAPTAADRTAADTRLLREANNAASAKAAVPSAARSTVVNEARLPKGSEIITPMATPMARPANRPVAMLPSIAPSKTDPIGSMPRMQDLAALNPTITPVAAKPPAAKPRVTTSVVKDRVLNPDWKESLPAGAALNTGSRDSVAASAAGKAAAANVPKFIERERVVTTTLPAAKPKAAAAKPTTVKPAATVNGRPTVARPTVVQAQAKADRPPLEIVVSGSNTQNPAGPVSKVQELRDQGLSPAAAYAEANNQARKKSEAASTTGAGYSSSGRKYDPDTNSWKDRSGGSSRAGDSGADSLSS